MVLTGVELGAGRDWLAIGCVWSPPGLDDDDRDGVFGAAFDDLVRPYEVEDGVAPRIIHARYLDRLENGRCSGLEDLFAAVLGFFD